MKKIYLPLLICAICISFFLPAFCFADWTQSENRSALDSCVPDYFNIPWQTGCDEILEFLEDNDVSYVLDTEASDGVFYLTAKRNILVHAEMVEKYRLNIERVTFQFKTTDKGSEYYDLTDYDYIRSRLVGLEFTFKNSKDEVMKYYKDKYGDISDGYILLYRDKSDITFSQGYNKPEIINVWYHTFKS